MFNGREPDERRYDFDFAALDSVAGRLWFLPTPSVALQVSVGRLNEAEPSHVGGAPRWTSTASRRQPRTIVHSAPVISGRRPVAWGANRELGKTTNGLLAESAVSLSGGHTWFGRIEVNGKPADDLHIHEFRQVFTVAKLQGGLLGTSRPCVG